MHTSESLKTIIKKEETVCEWVVAKLHLDWLGEGSVWYQEGPSLRTPVI